MTETKGVEETKQKRRIQEDTEIAAPMDEVWKALTEPKELVEWFPLGARVATPLASLPQENWRAKNTWQWRMRRKGCLCASKRKKSNRSPRWELILIHFP
jgi:uncharacterized protein YndB with AHSA1/START domain